MQIFKKLFLRWLNYFIRVIFYLSSDGGVNPRLAETGPCVLCRKQIVLAGLKKPNLYLYCTKNLRNEVNFSDVNCFFELVVHFQYWFCPGKKRYLKYCAGLIQIFFSKFTFFARRQQGCGCRIAKRIRRVFARFTYLDG